MKIPYFVLILKLTSLCITKAIISLFLYDQSQPGRLRNPCTIFFESFWRVCVSRVAHHYGKRKGLHQALWRAPRNNNNSIIVLQLVRFATLTLLGCEIPFLLFSPLALVEVKKDHSTELVLSSAMDNSCPWPGWSYFILKMNLSSEIVSSIEVVYLWKLHYRLLS